MLVDRGRPDAVRDARQEEQDSGENVLVEARRRRHGRDRDSRVGKLLVWTEGEVGVRVKGIRPVGSDLNARLR